MGTKHDILTEEELSTFNVKGAVLSQIDKFLNDHPNMKPENINILDWGCGRGRSVAKLRERGFSAFGVDIDLQTIAKGYPLLDQKGYSPADLLKPLKDVESFGEGFFHIIFSEQVFEHVEDLAKEVKVIFRLTAPGGIGIHCFPGSKMLWEEHLNMPLVHWFPKSILRKYWIAAMLFLSIQPKVSWPGAKGKSFKEQVKLYYHYMNDHTYYRDSEVICEEFKKSGFKSRYEVDGANSLCNKALPKYFRRNGFRYGNIRLYVNKAS